MSDVALTVADVPGASPTRAAVFTRSPQSVEVYEQGSWWPGSMLGWRHDARGTCQAWVRVEFAGVAEDAWVELTLLRLPEWPGERQLTLAREPNGTSGSAGPGPGARGAAAAVRDEQAAGLTGTQLLPLVGDGGVAPIADPMPRVTGRRRAPETGEQPAASPSSPSHPVGSVAPVQGGRPVLGRHRAPAAEGRHRAAETGVPGTVPTDLRGDAVADPFAFASGPDSWTPPPPRSELPPAGPVVRPTAVLQDAEEFLTRPLRLQERAGAARPAPRDRVSV